MYRNNYRSPQMGGQPRPNRNFGNGTCGMQDGRQESRNCCGEKRETERCMEKKESNCREERREEMRFGVVREKECGCEERREMEHCGEKREKECGCEEREEKERCGEKREKECGCEEREEMERCGEKREKECGCEEQREMDCDCMPSKTDPLEGMPLAIAYVAWQDYKHVRSEEEGWCKGTIFAQLDLDFMARRCN